MASAQWWRKGHSHLDESEIWLLRDGAAREYRRIVDRGAKALWPMWSAGRAALRLHVGPQRRREPLEQRPRAARLTPLTRFAAGRVLWPSISQRREDDRLRARLRHLDARHAAAARPGRSRSRCAARRPGRGAELPAPDGRVRGAGAVARRQEGRVRRARRGVRGLGEPRRRRAARDAHGAGRAPASPGPTTAGGSPTPRPARSGSHVFLYDFVSGQARQLSDGPGTDVRPQFVARRPEPRVPAGRARAARRGPEGRDRARRGDRLASTPRRRSTRRVRTPGRRTGAGSPSCRRTTGSSATRAWSRSRAASPQPFRSASWRTRTADGVTWSPDGSSLFFDSSQRTEAGQVARVDLVLRTPKFREQAVPRPVQGGVEAGTGGRPPRAGAKPAGDAAKADTLRKPAEIVRDGLRTRLTLLPVGVDVALRDREPGRQAAPDARRRRGLGQPLPLPARRALGGAPRRPAADLDRRAASAAPSSARTAKRSTTSRTAASSRSRSRAASRRSSPSPRGWRWTSTPRRPWSSTRPGAGCARISTTRP